MTGPASCWAPLSRRATISAKASIGVDIGGTFTDCVCLADGGETFFSKVPSTRRDPTIGAVEAVKKVLQLSGIQPEKISRLVHGTTMAINAILEKKGAPMGLLTTRGFEDMLTIGRQERSEEDTFNLFFESTCPEFLVPRPRRIGITERIGSRGNVLIPLNEDEVRLAAAKLVSEFDVTAIVICYLFSFRNPVHELNTLRIIRETFPHLHISVSCQVDPVFREYERLCVTAFNAYIAERASAYLDTFESKLKEMGIGAPVGLLQSRGAAMAADLARRSPVRTIMSGPAAGAIAAGRLGETIRLRDRDGKEITNFVSIDIGGTSTDIVLVPDRRPLLTTEIKLDNRYPLKIPAVDVVSFGAGGGTIAWIDGGGTLRVGPQSAGADPGPVCYGRGGAEVTVTDATLLLGFLDPGRFAGGQIRLDADSIRSPLEKLTKRLGLSSVYDTANAILRIVNTRVADQINLLATKRGYDPRTFALILAGGAGPMLGGSILDKMAVPLAIVPILPGCFCAFGALLAPIEHEVSRSLSVDATDPGALNLIRGLFDELSDEARRLMEREKVPASEITIHKFADMRYAGQSYELEIPLNDRIDGPAMLQAVRDFTQRHDAVFGHVRSGTPVQFVTFRCVHRFTSSTMEVSIPRHLRSAGDAQVGTRQAYFGEFLPTPVYDRFSLPSGADIRGPAIIEQEDTTTVIYPGQRAVVHKAGHIILHREV